MCINQLHQNYRVAGFPRCLETSPGLYDFRSVLWWGEGRGGSFIPPNNVKKKFSIYPKPLDYQNMEPSCPPPNKSAGISQSRPPLNLNSPFCFQTIATQMLNIDVKGEGRDKYKHKCSISKLNFFFKIKEYTRQGHTQVFFRGSFTQRFS